MNDCYLYWKPKGRAIQGVKGTVLQMNQALANLESYDWAFIMDLDNVILQFVGDITIDAARSQVATAYFTAGTNMSLPD